MITKYNMLILLVAQVLIARLPQVLALEDVPSSEFPAEKSDDKDELRPFIGEDIPLSKSYPLKSESSSTPTSELETAKTEPEATANTESTANPETEENPAKSESEEITAKGASESTKLETTVFDEVPPTNAAPSMSTSTSEKSSNVFSETNLSEKESSTSEKESTSEKVSPSAASTELSTELSSTEPVSSSEEDDSFKAGLEADEKAGRCCYIYGLGARMVPCCLKVLPCESEKFLEYSGGIEGNKSPRLGGTFGKLEENCPEDMDANEAAQLAKQAQLEAAKKDAKDSIHPHAHDMETALAERARNKEKTSRLGEKAHVQVGENEETQTGFFNRVFYTVFVVAGLASMALLYIQVKKSYLSGNNLTTSLMRENSAAE